MNQEEAEVIVSDPTGFSSEELVSANAMLGLVDKLVPAPRESFIEHLTRLEKTAANSAEQGVYSELLVIIGEAKTKASQVAKKVEGDDAHIAHTIAEYFREL